MPTAAILPMSQIAVRWVVEIGGHHQQPPALGVFTRDLRHDLRHRHSGDELAQPRVAEQAGSEQHTHDAGIAQEALRDAAGVDLPAACRHIASRETQRVQSGRRCSRPRRPRRRAGSGRGPAVEHADAVGAIGAAAGERQIGTSSRCWCPLEAEFRDGLVGVAPQAVDIEHARCAGFGGRIGRAGQGGAGAERQAARQNQDIRLGGRLSALSSHAKGRTCQSNLKRKGIVGGWRSRIYRRRQHRRGISSNPASVKLHCIVLFNKRAGCAIPSPPYWRPIVPV